MSSFSSAYLCVLGPWNTFHSFFILPSNRGFWAQNDRGASICGQTFSIIYRRPSNLSCSIDVKHIKSIHGGLKWTFQNTICFSFFSFLNHYKSKIYHYFGFMTFFYENMAFEDFWRKPKFGLIGKRKNTIPLF